MQSFLCKSFQDVALPSSAHAVQSHFLYHRVLRLVRRQLHVIINRGRERREASASHSRGLRTRLGRQRTAGDATGRDAVQQVVLRAELLKSAFPP